jgi:hypothetical protein
MKKNIIIYGLIAGIVVSISMLAIVSYVSHCAGTIGYTESMLVSYAAMLIAFSLVFVGIRNYRDKFNGGAVSFSKAFSIGIMIVLIASTIYVVAWLIDCYVFMPEFARMYKNPFYNVMMTYVEILPVGLVVTLISSLILKTAKNSKK